MLFEVLATALIGGAINTIGKSSARSEQNEKVERSIAMLEDAKYTNREREEYLDKVSDVWNTNILDTLNESSVGIALSGAVNPEAVRTGVASKLLGQKEATLLKSFDELEHHNKRLDLRMSSLEMMKETGSPLEDFASGAVGGAALGLQINDYLETQKLNEKYFGSLDKIFPEDKGILSGALESTTTKLEAVDKIFKDIKKEPKKSIVDIMLESKEDF